MKPRLHTYHTACSRPRDRGRGSSAAARRRLAPLFLFTSCWGSCPCSARCRLFRSGCPRVERFCRGGEKTLRRARGVCAATRKRFILFPVPAVSLWLSSLFSLFPLVCFYDYCTSGGPHRSLSTDSSPFPSYSRGAPTLKTAIAHFSPRRLFLSQTHLCAQTVAVYTPRC